MIRSIKLWLGLIGIFFLILLSPTSIHAGEPTDAIRTALDQGLAVVNNEGARRKGKDEQVDRLREIARHLFNFDEMARRSLGKHWRQLSADDRLTFVNVFTDFLQMTYAEKIGLYKGAKLKFVDEEVDENYARVDAIVTGTQWEDFPVSYKLSRDHGNWKVYDVYVANVSLVNNYRVQFGRIITRQSYKDLVRMIKEKTK